MKTKDIELRGDAIESFERVEGIKEIILLGEKGGVRRIIVERDNLEEIRKAVNRLRRLR